MKKEKSVAFEEEWPIEDGDDCSHEIYAKGLPITIIGTAGDLIFLFCHECCDYIVLPYFEKM